MGGLGTGEDHSLLDVSLMSIYADVRDPQHGAGAHQIDLQAIATLLLHFLDEAGKSVIEHRLLRPSEAATGQGTGEEEEGPSFRA